MVMVTDPKALKQILIREFEKFPDRAFPAFLPYPLSLNVMEMTGQRWKRIRSIITPVFTSGKLRYLFPLLREVGNEIVETLKEFSESNNHIDIKR